MYCLIPQIFHNVKCYMHLLQGQMFVRLQNGAELDRETNSRIYARVIARDNPIGSADNQNQRAAFVSNTTVYL